MHLIIDLVTLEYALERKEIESWRLTAIVMVLASASLSIYDWFVSKIFLDLIFPICLVYIPTFISIIIYLVVRRVGGRSQV
jgi:hypothetical protein